MSQLLLPVVVDVAGLQMHAKHVRTGATASESVGKAACFSHIKTLADTSAITLVVKVIALMMYESAASKGWVLILVSDYHPKAAGRCGSMSLSSRTKHFSFVV